MNLTRQTIVKTTTTFEDVTSLFTSIQAGTNYYYFFAYVFLWLHKIT